MELNPFEKGSDQACTYCAYKKVCGFDPGIPGYRKRLLKDLGRQEALEVMEDELESGTLFERSCDEHSVYSGPTEGN